MRAEILRIGEHAVKWEKKGGQRTRTDDDEEQDDDDGEEDDDEEETMMADSRVPSLTRCSCRSTLPVGSVIS